MLDKALALASRGFRVFPCVPNTKLPTITDWPNKATTDEATIRDWWSGKCVVTTKAGKNLKLKKNCNIGVAPGLNYIIVDVDVKGGYKESLAKLKADGLPPTFTVRTPSGGLHLYYRHPGGRVRSQANWMPGIDIRGNGGQGVGPGSVIDGKYYEIAIDKEIADLPGNIKLSLPIDIPASAEPVVTGLVTQAEPSPYSTLPERVIAGERDDVLFRYACSWRARNYTKENAMILMWELYNRCDPDPIDPFTLPEALSKVDRAYNEYNPTTATDWINLVTEQGEIEISKEDIKKISDALKRFVFIEKLNRVADLTRHPKNAVLTLQEFLNSYANTYIDDKQMPRKWLSHPKRKTVVDVGYKPLGEKIFKEYGGKYYNLYYGSGLTLPDVVDPEKIKVPLEHMKYMFPEKRDAMQFINWMAHTVQRPDIRIPWAPLIISSPGVGKGWIYLMLQSIVGRQNCALLGAEEFLENSKFTEFMRGKIVCMDELRSSGRINLVNKLKHLMTEVELAVNIKHGTKQQERVYVNFICFSNYGDAAALTYDDRRFWVHRVPNDRREPTYYKRLFGWLSTDGPAHWEKWLSLLDVSKFNPQEPPPMTEAKNRMVENGMAIITETIFDAIQDGFDIFKSDIVSAQLVEKFISREIDDIRLTGKERHEIKQCLAELSKPLPQNQYRVRFPNSETARQIRLKCIRNHEKWVKVESQEIVNEFVKAWKIGVGAPVEAK